MQRNVISVAFGLLFSVAQGSVSIGLFIALVQASPSVVSMMSWEFYDRINEFSQQKEYLKDVTIFANLVEVDGATALPASPINVRTIGVEGHKPAP